jgi:7,8-dihydropterin-6-yl-methyl-4-(beta-D-ribofuranosyl)aminobenzene 5'-phosphate synthase
MRRHVKVLCVPVAILLATQVWTLHALGNPPQKAPEKAATQAQEPNAPVDKTRQRLVQLGERASRGNHKAIDQIRKIADRLYEGINYDVEKERKLANLKLMRAAFEPIAVAAGEGSEKALDALFYANRAGRLSSFVPDAMGTAAAMGNQEALDALLDYDKHGWLLTSAVFALQGAAEEGNAKAIEFLLGVVDDESHRGLWHGATSGLQAAAAKGNPRARKAIDKYTAWRESLNNSVLKVRFVYDNYAYRESFKTNWGFACVVEGMEKTILFDTGQKGELLLENFEKMGLDRKSPDLVVLSHDHNDHTGGLTEFLAKNHDVSVYVPVSFPKEFEEEVNAAGAKVVPVKKPVEICKNVFLTGQMGGSIKEQGLILDTRDGLVLITGCAHPGIVAMTKRAKKHLKKDVVMVLGGFHLNQLSESEAKSVAEELKAMGVRKVGPTHCTGKEAIASFEEVFGENFLKLGVGRTLPIGMAP